MILSNTGVLGLSLGKFDEYNSFLFLNNSGGVTTAYVTSGVGGSGTPIFAERSSTLLLTYTGVTVPPSNFGYSGDWAIYNNNYLTGPKPSNTGSWPSGFNLIVSGVTGAAGGSGAAGAAGSGVPASGGSGKILSKKSNTSYDTEWSDAVDIVSLRKQVEMDRYRYSSPALYLRNANRTLIDNIGYSITFNPRFNYYVVTSVTDKYIYFFSLTFKFIEKIELTFLGLGEIAYGIDWILGDEYLICTNDGSSSPKIYRFTAASLSAASLTQDYDTGLPSTTIISGVSYDHRNDRIYLSQQSNDSGVWLIRYIDGGYLMSGILSTAFNLATSDLNGGAAGTLEILDIHYKRDNNTIVLYCGDGGIGYLFEIDMKDGTPLKGNLGSSPVEGLSSIPSAEPSFGGYYPAGFCFREDNLYLVSNYILSESFIRPISSSSSAKIEYDSFLDSKNYVVGPGKEPYRIEEKLFQSLDVASKTETQSFDNWSGNNFLGTREIVEIYPSPGFEIENECFGKLSTFRNTSIFPRNYGSDTGVITPDQISYLAQSYYVTLPSGLSGVPWRYKSNIVVRDYNTGTLRYDKSIQSHFEVFSSPKIELFYVETGTFLYIASDVDMSITFAPSGSGNFTLYNQKIVVR